MAKATSHYDKLVKQLTAVSNEARSGTLVFNDGEGSICFMFGEPTHAEFTASGKTVKGKAALTAFVNRLSRPIKVSWQRTIVPDESLEDCTIDDILEPFKALAAGPATQVSSSHAESPAEESDEEFPTHLSLTLQSFPLLPVTKALWAEMPAASVNLDMMLKSLPTALLTITGENFKAAAIVNKGSIGSAIWVDAHATSAGRAAREAIVNNQEGAISAYTLDDDLADAIPLLWDLPVSYEDMESEWLDAERFMKSMQSDLGYRAVLVQSRKGRGVALLLRGKLFVYTSSSKTPSSSAESILPLLAPGLNGRVTILEGAASRSEVAPVEADLEEPSAPELHVVPNETSLKVLDDETEEDEVELTGYEVDSTEEAESDGEAEEDVEETSETEANETEESHSHSDTYLEAAEHKDAEEDEELPWTPSVTYAEADSEDETDEHEAAEESTGSDSTATPLLMDEEDDDEEATGGWSVRSGNAEDQEEAADEEEGEDMPPLQVMAQLSEVEDEELTNNAAGFTIEDIEVEESLIEAPESTSYDSYQTGGSVNGGNPAPASLMDSNLFQPSTPGEIRRESQAESPRLVLDWDGILADLVAIAERRLGEQSGEVEELLHNTVRSARGILQTLDEISNLGVEGFSQKSMKSMTKEMRYIAAERCTGA